jgi:hypothetical protein
LCVRVIREGLRLVISFTELSQNVTTNKDYDLLVAHILQLTRERTNPPQLTAFTCRCLVMAADAADPSTSAFTA